MRVNYRPIWSPVEGRFRCKTVAISRSAKSNKTRMHSSRMRTVRCSGRLPGGGCLHGGVLPGVCLGGGCLRKGVYTPSPDPEADTPPPWTDERLRKHYLFAATVVDGNNVTCDTKQDLQICFVLVLNKGLQSEKGEGFKTKSERLPKTRTRVSMNPLN